MKKTQDNRPTEPIDWGITRRHFLAASGLVVAKICDNAGLAHAADGVEGARLRFGLVTDAHYADTDTRTSRYYRESTTKMAECVSMMNSEGVDFLVELGDLKDEGSPPSEGDTLKNLAIIEDVFKQFKGPRYHVLGNHDVDSISKPQFLAGVENTGISQASSYYAFDARDVRCVVLDANYRADGSDYDHGNFQWTDVNIPPQQLDWLQETLAATAKPVIVFVHQLLDGTGSHYVNNAAQVRRILQESGRVLAVFQGHYHEGQYQQIEHIHYYTLKAMVEGTGEENNAFAIVEVDEHHNIMVTGYRQAVGRTLHKSALALRARDEP